MTREYFAKQRTWFITIQLHPPQILQSRFTSIKLFLYNSSCFFSTLCSPEPPNPLPPTREKHYRCTILFGVKTGPSNHSAVISLTERFLFVFVLLQDLVLFFFFFFLTELQTGFNIHLHSLQAPGSFSFPDNRRDLTFRRGGNYDCLLYKNVQWLY